MIKQALYFALRRFIKTRHNFQMRQLNVGSADFLDRRDDSGVNVPCNICPLCDISLCALLLLLTYFEPSKQVYINFLCPIVLSKL